MERDQKGDVKYGLSQFDWKQFQENRYTYVFHHYDSVRDGYIPHFDLFSLEEKRMEKARLDPDFQEVRIYKAPEHPPYDFHIWHANQQLAMLVEFFKEVFEERAFIDGYLPQNKYYTIILPTSKYNEIINFINDFELLPIRDLLFEVIAIAQNKYVEEIAFWERPEYQKLVTSAEKETEKVIKVIEKLDDKAWLRGVSGAKPPSKLEYINFVFNDDTIKLEHEWLAREFIEHFRGHYDALHYKNWRKDLGRYPHRFEDNIKGQQFKYKLAKSFYNLLSKTGFFKVAKSQPTPSKLMLCIARLLEFCLIPVGTPDELDEIKIKIVRNWIKRKELEPALTYADVPANKARLTKYFESEFIALPDDKKRADAISIGMYIGERFDMLQLAPDLIHLVAALKEYHWFIGHQMFGDSVHREGQFEELESFRKFVRGIKEGQKVKSVRFKMDESDEEFELGQRLPLYLIEEAIRSIPKSSRWK